MTGSELARYIGIGIPPPHGEANAAYYASVCERLQPEWWHDWRHGQIGAPGYAPMIWWLRQTEPNFVQGLDVAAEHDDCPAHSLAILAEF